MSNIILNTKTYAGPVYMNGLSTWTERSGTVAAAFSPLTGSFRFDTKSRLNWKVAVPIVAAEDSSCSCTGAVLRVSDCSISIRMDPGATTAERTDFALRLKDLVASTEFQSSIINLQQPA